jgi:hypothetical protein
MATARLSANTLTEPSKAKKTTQQKPNDLISNLIHGSCKKYT